MVASSAFTKFRGLRGTPGTPPGSAPVLGFAGFTFYLVLSASSAVSGYCSVRLFLVC